MEGESMYADAYGGLTENISPIVRTKLFLHRFHEETKRNSALALSVGCEFGTWERDILGDSCLAQAMPQLRIIGVDIDKDAIGIARVVMPAVVGDIRVLPFESESFSLVYSPLVIQWVLQTERIKAFEEMVRVLKRGGWLYVIVPGLFHLEEDLDYLPEFAAVSKGELMEMKKSFFISADLLKSYIPKGTRIVSLNEIKEEMIPSPSRRVALVYADTLALNIPHDESGYRAFLKKLKSKTTINWVEIIVIREV